MGREIYHWRFYEPEGNCCVVGLLVGISRVGYGLKAYQPHDGGLKRGSTKGDTESSRRASE